MTDPIQAQGVNLASAVQALLVRQGAALEGSTLMALLGQDVDVLFQALAPGGVKLQFPSGQTVTAQGELPYPEGTQLRVRILPAAPGETGLRLQLQEARPPAPPALLSPLTQSEAATLAARLTQIAPPPELAPLVRLLSLLEELRPDAGTSLSPERLQAALRELPGTLPAGLGRALGRGETASIQELSNALRDFLLDPRLTTPDPETGPVGRSFKNPAQQVVPQLQALISRHPEIPEGDRDALVLWVRNLLHQTTEEAPPAPRPATALPGVRTEPGPRPGPGIAADSLIPPKLTAALQSHPGARADLPEAWESWIRGTVTTLSNPAAFPRESAFHALQAKEGTAFFELPLPWTQASPLQLWVEADAPEARQGGVDSTKRVLLGLSFSRLGETRLGLAQGPSGLRIRIWTEHPEALETEKENLRKELESLGKTVDLRIYALGCGPDGTIPSVRSLVVGPSLSALG